MKNILSSSNSQISMKHDVIIPILYALGLIVVTLSAMYYFSIYHLFNYFIDVWMRDKINPYVFSIIFILLTFFLGNMVFNRKLSKAECIPISVFFTLFLMALQITRFFLTHDSTNTNSNGEVGYQVIFSIVTLAFGIIACVGSMFIIEKLKKSKEKII